jgi:hypothetical protein
MTVHFAGREERNLLAAAVMSSLVSAATLVLGIVAPPVTYQFEFFIAWVAILSRLLQRLLQAVDILLNSLGNSASVRPTVLTS